MWQGCTSRNLEIQVTTNTTNPQRTQRFCVILRLRSGIAHNSSFERTPCKRLCIRCRFSERSRASSPVSKDAGHRRVSTYFAREAENDRSSLRTHVIGEFLRQMYRKKELRRVRCVFVVFVVTWIYVAPHAVLFRTHRILRPRPLAP